ncbi:MAG: LysR substrate-binding domain-containing protein [Pseudomonadota bacterium]
MGTSNDSQHGGDGPRTVAPPRADQRLLDSEQFELGDLRAFGLIASAGGLSAAERSFGISKAALSRAVAKLEAAAGGPLFDRIPSGMRLTSLGEMLRPLADQAVALMRDAGERIRSVQGEPQGELRIASSAMSGHRIVAPALTELARRYPAVSTTLRITSRGPDPLAENLDIVVRIGKPPEPYLVSRLLIRSDLALYVAAGGHDGDDLDDPKAVEALGRIVIGVDGVPADWPLTETATGREITMRSRPLLDVGDPMVAMGVLRSGPGVACIPRIFGEPAIREGTLRPALPGWRGPALEMYLAMPARRASVPAVRVLLDMLRARAEVLSAGVSN